MQPRLLNLHAPAWLMLAVIALLPFGRLYSLPLAIMLVCGLWVMVVHRQALFRLWPARLFLVLFLCYWLPTLISSIDAYDPWRSLFKSLVILRFVPVGLFVIWTLAQTSTARLLERMVAIVLAFWCIDALIQFTFGANLLGMSMSPDRLNGIFGETNIKLGQTLSVLSPLLIEYCRRHTTFAVTVLSYLLLLTTILLTGTRAAWVSFAVVSLYYVVLYARAHPGRWMKSVSLISLACLMVGFAGYQTSERFAARIDRTLEVVHGDSVSIDFALAYRLPIWSTSVQMAVAHPINGVGIRSFRYAYPDYAAEDDPWISYEENRGAAHSHQIILEFLTETGVIGLTGLLLGVLLVIRSYRLIHQSDRYNAWPYLLALLAMTFPLNSHLAFYSTYWSVLFWWLLMCYCARIGDCEIKADEPEAVGVHHHPQQRGNLARLSEQRSLGG